MRVAILIRTLELAGAERQAMLLARELAGRGHDVTLVLLHAENSLAPEARARNVRVVALSGRGLPTAIRTIVRLIQYLRAERPEVLYGFMDGPNVLVGSIGFLVPGMRRIAGIRSGSLLAEHMKILPNALRRLEPSMTRWCHAIIVNSHAGEVAAIERGFAQDLLHVVENGIDVEEFRHSESEGAELRQSLGFGPGELLIGRVGRLHPMKGWDDFLDSVALVAQLTELPIRVLCVGSGGEGDRLRGRCKDLGIEHVVTWEGTRRDMRAVYSAMDVLVSSSTYGEGVPNVVAEAMACEVPCVVTDVGDSARVVGDAGLVVAAGDSRSLARAVVKVLEDQDRRRMGAEARARVSFHYSLDSLVEATVRILEGRR